VLTVLFWYVRLIRVGVATVIAAIAATMVLFTPLMDER